MMKQPVDPDDVEYDSWIAHNTTYIEETKRVLQEYVEHKSFDAVKERVIEQNILNKNTNKYRKDVFREIARRYIPREDEYVETPLMHVLASDVDDSVKEWVLYYEFSQNSLIHRLTIDFLYEKYTTGALLIQAPEIRAYITELGEDHPEIQDWSQSTLEETSTKYLSSLKNFGLLKGVQEKEFAVFYVPDETIAYVCYRLYGSDAETVDELVSHPDWRLFLFDEDEVRRRLQGISPRYVRYEKRGSTERIEPVFDDINEVIDDFE